MMRMDSHVKPFGKVAIYSLLVGGVYMLAGLTEVLNGVGFLDVKVFPADIAEGVVLLVIAVLYMVGLIKLPQGEQESLPYTIVGSLLAATLFVLYLSIMGANGLGYLFQFEDWLDWRWLDDLRPGIWLFPLAVPGILAIRRKREKGMNRSPVNTK